MQVSGEVDGWSQYPKPGSIILKPCLKLPVRRQAILVESEVPKNYCDRTTRGA